MSVPSLVKQPSENRVYVMDFSGLMSKGETIASVTSVTYTGPDVALTLSGPVTYSGVYAQQRIEGGTSGIKYKVTFVVTTSLGNTLQGEGLLQVKDL